MENGSSDRHGSLPRLGMYLSSRISLIVSNFREPFKLVYVNLVSENYEIFLHNAQQFLGNFISRCKNYYYQVIREKHKIEIFRQIFFFHFSQT